MGRKLFFRYVLLTVLGLASFLALFLISALGRVDRTPARELPSYDLMMARLDSVQPEILPAREGFSVGYGVTSITPSRPMATAGYGSRRGKPYLQVLDSVFVRAMVIGNGAGRVAIVSADLLIVPPTVTRILPEKLAPLGFSLDNTYLGATHSHNSIGQWGEGATRFIYGAYNDTVVHFIADAIAESIRIAASRLLPAKLSEGAIAIPGAVENRLIDRGDTDPYLRAVEIVRSDSSRLLLTSYAAHATCLSQRTNQLSGDYPALLVRKFETRGYDFAMFLAGAVGSQRAAAPGADLACMSWMANAIEQAFFEQRHTLRQIDDSTLVMVRTPLALGTPQVKISSSWKLRAWVFRAAFGEYPSFLTALRIGNVVLAGTPCDFSGELTPALSSAAAAHGMNVIPTSFNGGYIGYVTPGRYYDVDHYETQLMNWYAPGTGDYMVESLIELTSVVSGSR